MRGRRRAGGGGLGHTAGGADAAFINRNGYVIAPCVCIHRRGNIFYIIILAGAVRAAPFYTPIPTFRRNINASNIIYRAAR